MAITAVKDGGLAPTVIQYGDGESASVKGDNITSLPGRSSAVGYWNWNKGNLTVKYRGSQDFYRYIGVSLGAVLRMMNAESLGAFIATEVKPNYEVVKI